MAKVNMQSLAADIRKQFKDSPKLAKKIGVGSNLSTLEDKDFLTLKPWFKKAVGVPGLPYGKMVMIAGDSDSGKTSFAIEAMKCAQEQGVGVIYIETEGKTTGDDLKQWGVDADSILLIQSSMAEEAFDLLFAAWDAFKERYPDTKLLIIIDSLGNVISQRDSEINLTEQNSSPGGKGKINRLAVNKMVVKQEGDGAAILAINYTYDNIGSVGKTNSGGKALNFFSCLTLQTMRKSWIEKTVQGQKVRVGAEVKWTLFKNHLHKDGNKKDFILEITKDGIEYVPE